MFSLYLMVLSFEFVDEFPTSERCFWFMLLKFIPIIVYVASLETFMK